MNKILLVLATVTVFASCKNADQQSGTALTPEQKEKVTRDSANFTTIQWLDSTYRDLGKINEGQVVEVSYRFRNAGNKNLVIADVKASCGCTIPEKPEKPFAPGEEGVIKAKFDSKGKEGLARKEIYVTANTAPDVNTTLQFSVDISTK